MQVEVEEDINILVLVVLEVLEEEVLVVEQMAMLLQQILVAVAVELEIIQLILVEMVDQV
jgi:hypothetical protein